MYFEYNLVKSEFYITEKDFEKIYNKDGFTIYGNKKLDEKRESNKQEIKIFSDYGDASWELKKYEDEIRFDKDGYKVTMYWVDEDDGYNGGERVDYNDEFDVVVPNPKFDKEV